MIKLIFFLSYLCFIIFNVNCTNNVSYAKDVNSKIKVDQHIHQLHQISDAHSQYLIQIQQQLLENQKNIDSLLGYIQEIQHEITKMTNDYQELNKKLNEISINNCNYNKKINKNNNILKESITDSSQTKFHEKVNTISSNITDELAYKQAVALVLEKKQYNDAIKSFQNFIENYPESDYHPNAHYWLGQLYYNQKKKNEASYHFAIVVKNYPKSPKAPDALLKIGIIMYENSYTEKAKTIYRQLGKLYPNSEAAKQAQKRLANL